MSVHQNINSEENTAQLREGLTYDAEGVSLIGKYADELSAHRAKRTWKNVLGNSFLLDEGRDYELWVSGSLGEENFVLSCSFLSACGRYAFWRLINEQAPDAEKKLRGEMPLDKNLAPFFSNLDSNQAPWIMRLSEELDQVEQNQGLIKKILKLFN